VRAGTGAPPLQNNDLPENETALPAGGDLNLMGKAIEYAAGSEGALSFMFS
jgi:hypothetical protein